MKTWEQQKEKDGYPDRCPRCNDTGAITVPNGPDDFDIDYCQCSVGQKMEKEDEIKRR